MQFKDFYKKNKFIRQILTHCSLYGILFLLGGVYCAKKEEQ